MNSLETLVASGMSEEVAIRMTEQQFVNPVSILDKILAASRGRKAESQE